MGLPPPFVGAPARLGRPCFSDLLDHNFNILHQSMLHHASRVASSHSGSATEGPKFACELADGLNEKYSVLGAN